MKYTILGLVLDAVDWIAVGLIPVLGDIVDVVGAFIWYRLIGPLGIASLIELVPLVDILPTNMLLGAYADGYIKGRRKHG